MGVLSTMIWIIFGGVTHGNLLQPLKGISDFFSFNILLSFSFGQACVKSIYSYLGYYNVCHLGAEIKRPEKNIPRSMFISIAGIMLLYLLMNLSVTNVIPWQEIKAWQDGGINNFVVSIFIERLYGKTAASIATVMILWVAIASLFAVLLGYSRVPYAAAVNGTFFRFFAKLHPTKNFPHVSLLVLGGLAFCFSLLFKLKDVITAIIIMRILVQFISKTIGLISLNLGNAFIMCS